MSAVGGGGGDATKCPQCRKPSSRATAGKVFPFCSQRCWAIDLGKWLGEEYRISDEGDGSGASASSPEDPEA